MKHVRKELLESGYIIDDTCYPNYAYKGGRFNSDSGIRCHTELEAELLETLQEVDKLFDETELVKNTNESRRVWEEVRKAIKKATE